jgi:dolichyl-diphosphooligosaccharide---protein glycosyltransferase
MQSLDVDYVLVIFGGVANYASDDINKFLWPVRIGSGVFGKDMPSEKDFMSESGQFDVGPGGSKILHNCLAYKLSYYRFVFVSKLYLMSKHDMTAVVAANYVSQADLIV